MTKSFTVLKQTAFGGNSYLPGSTFMADEQAPLIAAYLHFKNIKVTDGTPAAVYVRDAKPPATPIEEEKAPAVVEKVPAGTLSDPDPVEDKAPVVPVKEEKAASKPTPPEAKAKPVDEEADDR